MIREWKKSESNLIRLMKDKGGKGRRRHRIDGVGSKLAYYDLDQHLIEWYRSKRGLEGSVQEDINISREKVSFKGMIRQGQRFCFESKS